MGEVTLNLFEMFSPVAFADRPVTLTHKFDEWYKLELGGEGEIRISGELSFTFK
jgi:hypothetical protein